MRHRTVWGSEEQSPSHADRVGKADYGPDCPGRSHILHGGNTVNHQRGPQTGTVAGSPRWCPQDRWQQRSRHSHHPSCLLSLGKFMSTKKRKTNISEITLSACFSLPSKLPTTITTQILLPGLAWHSRPSTLSPSPPLAHSPLRCGIPTDLPNRSSTWNVFLPPGCLSKFHPLYTCPHL